ALLDSCDKHRNDGGEDGASPYPMASGKAIGDSATMPSPSDRITGLRSLIRVVIRLLQIRLAWCAGAARPCSSSARRYSA
ncbi:hypothetical protein, partial [Pseudorhizobium flavum]|uniref:hypothetical protein n=1 Tax=Pseudorhizobium flavum TaxID=1335061 RepID=UPI001AEC8798